MEHDDDCDCTDCMQLCLDCGELPDDCECTQELNFELDQIT